ncbi:MAG: ABC transporter ATP-binding protein [Anaerolineae bacterium]|nr:ABC transporter ATP-binding protein [Anaerolineae bacterium]
MSLQIAAGETFGLLGPNGAGKTTLVKMLCTLILPTSGSAQVAGYSLGQPAGIRAGVGLVVTDERSFYWRLTGRQNLAFFAAMHGLQGAEAKERMVEVLAAVELEDRADAPFSHYSTGMRQRLSMARSLLHRPQLLFLDEPTRSLDPVAQARLHRLLQQLASERGVTIFLITHDLAEAEKLCERVAVMHEGQVKVVGSPAALRRQIVRHLSYRVRVHRWQPAFEAQLRQWLPGLAVEAGTGHTWLRFEAAEGDGVLDRILDYLRTSGVGIESIEGAPPTLEEVFSYFTGEA